MLFLAMRKFSLFFFQLFTVWLALFGFQKAFSQQSLKLTDFAIWGGSSPASAYTSAQGVFIKNAANIKGNIGSNHILEFKNDFTVSGNLHSGNLISFKNNAKITGNTFAQRSGTASNPVVSGGNNAIITGGLTAAGRISLGNNTQATGQIAVPSPTATNYSGPTPSGGISNSVDFPALPSMPENTPFDNLIGTATITSTQTITPNAYKKLALKGNQTLTFDGPGNYIFFEVDNSTSTNKFVFDFKGTTSGNINIYVIKDARWGRLSVSMKNGAAPSRIFTEVHGNGSTNGGVSFDLRGASTIPTGSNLWLGSVWVPNGTIAITSSPILPSGASHVIGSLWSGKKVDITNDFRLTYETPVAELNFNTIVPYYPPPVDGKVSAAFNTIGAELFSLAQNPTPIASIPNNDIFILDNAGNVMIEVVTEAPSDQTVRSRLIGAGMTDLIDNGPHVHLITGNFPISKLGQLNEDSALNLDRSIKAVYPLYPPISNVGLVTTQGDITMRSNTVRSRFEVAGTGEKIDGTGIKIGVISDSYDAKLGAQTDINEGDLPGIKTSGLPNENPHPVQVLDDLSGRGSDEGRAMLQIVHDVAPKAKLAFCTGFLSPGSFARAIDRLSSDTLTGGRCDVIVDDITYITEPFLDDGVVAQAVDRAVTNGVTYISSAGNFGRQSYEADFRGVTATSVVSTGQVHNFAESGVDVFQSVTLRPGSYTIVLQWSDDAASRGSSTGARSDLDLYVMGANGFKLFGFNRSSISGDPFEVCPFTVRDTTNAKIVVARASGSGYVRFKYIIFRGDATILNHQAGTSTIVGHPNSDSALAVGAMLYANFPTITPVWPGVASFSSRGGTKLVKNGVLLQPRNKPELIAPNGVNTTVNLGGAQFNDGDTYPNFFGTSAAAPHVAGVAGLLVQARKKFNLQTEVLPYEIRNQLITSAGKFSYLNNNFSFEGGYGYVQADSAVLQIANARPIISTLEAVIPGAETGTQPFDVKITGKYLTDNTTIYVDGVPVGTTVSIDPATGIGTAIATVAVIPPGSDPPFRLYNTPKSISGLDGGFSEELRFFNSTIRVVVKADNKSRKYGQENPFLTSSITIINGSDVLDISQTSLTRAGLKLDQLTLSTNATPFSSPRSYGIGIARTTPLEENDPLLSQYAFEFEPGTLTVERMPLWISPNDKSIRYGDDISNITYRFLFDTSGVLNTELEKEVRSLYKKHLAENGLVVLNGYSSQNADFTSADFQGMSVMASFQSVNNARKFLVENGQWKQLTNTLPASQIGDQRFVVDASMQSLQNYKADIAQSTLVESVADTSARGFLNIKPLTNGSARAAIPGGDLQPMVNGQLLAMVNGQLLALVNGQLQALVNGVPTNVQDISFQNGQLLAMVNGVWISVPSGQIIATVNGQQVTVELSVANGQLQALVNGQPMVLVNGQLQALVNGQLLALVNGQLKAMVNAQLTPLVNGQLVAMVNGQLQALVNGQLLAMVNGQLMALVNGQLEAVQDLLLVNGQLQALVNGQLQALVNGQLKAMVNGTVTDVVVNTSGLVNGQLQALVNGQEAVYVNGQLFALVNGQLQALVNGAGLPATSARQLANGQLQALVNGTYIPITNGQLVALVNDVSGSLTNGQLLAMVNGQLMAMVNGELTFAVFANGQLQALVNGANGDERVFEPLVNGQLLALVNGQLQALVNSATPVDNSYSIVNGQLQALVNGQSWTYTNGQLLALVNGQLQALVNNFDVSGPYNNAKTVVVVDEDDINLQAGDIGGMVSMHMVTGLEAGNHLIIPGSFVNENFEVSYGLGTLVIKKKPLVITADNKTKMAGDPNPALTVSYSGFAFDDTPDSLMIPVVLPPVVKSIDQLERRTTYTNVVISGTSGSYVNGQSNAYVAAPGEALTITGNWNKDHFQNIIPGYIAYCPGCITQNYVGMINGDFTGNQFDYCYDVSGVGTASGSFNISFPAPTRPGVYYITQVSDWWFFCYQFGHKLHDQVAAEAIAVVLVNPSNEVTANTTATDESQAGTYPIIVGGTHFNPNYRIVYVDGTLTVQPSAAFTMRNGQSASSSASGESPTAKKGREDELMLKANALYPNPASDFVRLLLPDKVNTVGDLRVFDPVGKEQNVVGRRISEHLFEFRVAHLRRGVYIIRARTDAGIRTFKFMKM